MLLFLLSLYLCIIMHELAHLITAKLVKCKVEIFSIGFGKELFRFKMGETIYRFALFPLGGYNKLKNELSYSRSPYAFTNLSYSKKMFIILAGCFINIIMGVLAFLLGRKLYNYELMYFGWLSFVLGISNLIPFPALDGSYIILVWLEKLLGKKKGYNLMNRICHYGFIVLIIINVACIPLLVWMIFKGML